MNRPALSFLAVASIAAAESLLPFDRTHRYTPPADPGHFKGGRGGGLGTDADGRGKRKRLAKRRAKKGYR